MKIKDVVRLAKANNPALVHLSNVWAQRTGDKNPVVTTKTLRSDRLSLLIFSIFVSTLWTLGIILKVPAGGVTLVAASLSVPSVILLVFIGIALMDGTLSFSVKPKDMLSAKRFMKAVTFLEKVEFSMTIDKWNPVNNIDWNCSSPQSSLDRMALKDSYTNTRLKDMAREVAKLQSIAWRQKEAEVKKKEFEEFHKTMIGLLDIPSDYGYYFPPAPAPKQEGITIH